MPEDGRRVAPAAPVAPVALLTEMPALEHLELLAPFTWLRVDNHGCRPRRVSALPVLANPLHVRGGDLHPLAGDERQLVGAPVPGPGGGHSDCLQVGGQR